MNTLELAIKMELEGEKYYRVQAEKNKGNSLRTVFLMLAEDEAKHALALQNKQNQVANTLPENDIVAKSRNVFANLGDVSTEAREVPNQLDVYRAALDMEKESITLYEKLLSEATDEEEKALLEYLIKEEKNHFIVLQELVEHVGRPEQWVESAEFGRRKEY